jgi:hypothetical protein
MKEWEARSFEHINEPSGSLKAGIFYYLSDYQLLKKDSAPPSHSIVDLWAA